MALGRRRLAVSVLLALVAEPLGYTCTDGRSTSRDLPGGRLSVTSICLGRNIAGPPGGNEARGHFRGPSPMHAVADKSRPGTIYFAWTEDLDFGASEAGADGRVHVTKLALSAAAPHAAKAGEASFDGFMRAGDLDITPEGKLGVMCAKHVPAWVSSFIEYMKVVKEKESYGDEMAPLLLGVCHVDSATMQPVGTPWRIGKSYMPGGASMSEGDRGNYPLTAWHAIRDGGYGWLTFADELRTWTTWYGATWGSHTGYAMHTYFDDSAVVDTVFNLTTAGLENREEPWPACCPRKWADWNRHGTGDHQMGSMTRYHPLLKEIAVVKHTHGPLYMQHYGLAPLTGNFFHEKGGGHLTGRVQLNCTNRNDTARSEGAIRPCGLGWIMAMVTDQGNVCAKMNRNGTVTAWELINASLGEENSNLGQYRQNKLVRLATLGRPEASARCGASGRFLMGYEAAGGRRMLVEIDGDCRRLTEPVEVTESTAWPRHQEWVTTAEGAVAWVTAWDKDASGADRRMEWGTKPAVDDGASRGGVRTFGPTVLRDGADPGSQEEAQVTVYWPSAGGGEDSTEPPVDEVLDVCTGPQPTTTRAVGSKSVGDGPSGDDGDDSNGTSVIESVASQAVSAYSTLSWCLLWCAWLSQTLRS